MSTLGRYLFIIIGTILLGAYTYWIYPESSLPQDCTIDSIVVYKSAREMTVFQDKVGLKTYAIALGFEPMGDKMEEGDGRTPEGKYIIESKNPHSGFHLNLGISYPNEQDLAESHEFGVPPGGDIKIHGLKNGNGYLGKFHRWVDWTHGCIAVTNGEIEELYHQVPVGCTIEIVP